MSQPLCRQTFLVGCSLAYFRRARAVSSNSQDKSCGVDHLNAWDPVGLLAQIVKSPPNRGANRRQIVESARQAIFSLRTQLRPRRAQSRHDSCDVQCRCFLERVFRCRFSTICLRNRRRKCHDPRLRFVYDFSTIFFYLKSWAEKNS